MPLPAPVRRWAPAGVGVVVLALAAVLALVLTHDSPAPSRTAAAPTPGATVAAASGQHAPAPGQVALVAGPFTDRLRLAHVGLVRHPVGVQGEFAQLADTSELLDMEVQADFYAADGSLLGSRRRVLSQPDITRAGKGGTGEQRFGGDIVFTVQAPAAYADRVVSALVSVPVLVNE